MLTPAQRPAHSEYIKAFEASLEINNGGALALTHVAVVLTARLKSTGGLAPDAFATGDPVYTVGPPPWPRVLVVA
jgi:hypothetical protein